MKITLGIVKIVLALAIGILPLFTDCQSQGRAIELANGKTVPMKCHWTGIAEIGVAVPLGLIGIFDLFTKRKETNNLLNGMGIVLGALVILFPTFLIGVCANPDMLCNMIMKPGLILLGSLVILVSLVGFFNSRRMVEAAA